ncbi:MAG: glycosyltransferase family 4 protein [Syntrophobacteraceae bacterium]
MYAAFEVFPRPKGASTHIAAVVQALARQFAPVWLLCCGVGDMPAFQREGDIVIWRYKETHANMLRRALGFGRFVTSRLGSLRNRPMLALFRDPWGGYPMVRTLDQAATVFEVNGLPSWELAYRYPRYGRSPGLREKMSDLERFCLTASKSVFTVSDVTREALIARQVDPAKISVVPNCAAEVFLEQGGNSWSLAGDALDLPDWLNGRRWFGYIGSLHPWQGVELLVDAWAEIAEEWPEVGLLVVCGRRAPAVRRLRRQIRKRGLTDQVLLHPALSPERLAAVLPRLEFTCAPLLETARNVVQGCCPIKIVESMAAGTPVLASDLRVTRALVRHDCDGYLVRAGEVRDWALALRLLLRDRGLRCRLGREAAHTARTRFTSEVMSGRLQAVFQSAFAASQGPSKHSVKLGGSHGTAEGASTDEGAFQDGRNRGP